jgi:PAS domain S-box-containing protein
MPLDPLETITAYDVVLLVLALCIAFQISRGIPSLVGRIADTSGFGRGTWFGIASVTIGLSLLALSATAVLVFSSGPPTWLSVIPSIQGAGLALAASAFGLAMLEGARTAWVRALLAALLVGPAFAAMHFLLMSAAGWRTAATVDPRVTAAVFGLGFLIALATLRMAMALPDARVRHAGWLRAGSTALFLAVLAGIYFGAYVAAIRLPLVPGGGRAFVVTPGAAIAWTGGVLLLVTGVLIAADVDRRVRQRQRETEALRLSEDRFRSLVQASAQIVWTTAPDGQMLGDQSSWAEFTGQDEPAYRGWGWFNAVHPDDRERTAAVWEETLANRRAAELEHRVRRADGRYRSCLARVVPVLESGGRVREWVGTHTDITDGARMQQERELLAGAGRALSSSLDEHEILGAIAALVVPRVADWCTIDIGTVGNLNRVAATHADPARADRLRALDPTTEASRPSRVARLLETGESELVRDVTDDALREIAPDRADRIILRELGLASLIRVPLTARGQVVGMLTLGRARDAEPYDLRDLAVAEELARRAAIAIDNARLYSAAKAAIDARDEVLGIVSHDLRNPLGVVMSTSELLLDPQSAPEERNRYLQIIRRSARSMNLLINDLLDVGQSDNGTLAVDPRPADPAEIVVEACDSMRPLAAEKSQQLSHDLPGDLPVIRADDGRIQQVLSNLIGNAIKFTEPGGSIRVTARPVAEGVLFTVVDDGPGVPEEDLPHLFDRHWRARSTAHLGAGLGLAIAKGIVEAHGGRIWAESEPGVGTRIHFLLPAAPVTHEERPAVAAERGAARPAAIAAADG